MIAEIPYVVLIGGATLIGLWWANLMYDTGQIPHHVSRKISHMAGGVAFLLCPFLFSSFWWPLILAITFTIMLLYTHLYLPFIFRGTGGTGRLQAFAEVNYPATAIPIIVIGWGYFHQPWLAIVPLLYLAFGDAITGLIRNKVYGKEIKGNWGSAGMLITCLILAYFIHPYWIGAVGAITATLAEKYTKTSTLSIGRCKFPYDDNLTVPILSFAVMLLLVEVGG